MIVGYRYSNNSDLNYTVVDWSNASTNTNYFYWLGTWYPKEYIPSDAQGSTAKRIRHSYRLMWRYVVPKFLAWLSSSYRSVFKLLHFPRGPPYILSE